MWNISSIVFWDTLKRTEATKMEYFIQFWNGHKSPWLSKMSNYKNNWKYHYHSNKIQDPSKNEHTHKPIVKMSLVEQWNSTMDNLKTMWTQFLSFQIQEAERKSKNIRLDLGSRFFLRKCPLRWIVTVSNHLHLLIGTSLLIKGNNFKDYISYKIFKIVIFTYVTQPFFFSEMVRFLMTFSFKIKVQLCNHNHKPVLSRKDILQQISIKLK